MAKNRMAGSDEFKDELSKSQRRERGRERIANDPERAKDRLAQVGEEYDLEGYSDKEVIMAFQGKDFGDKDYARLTGNPIEGGDDGGGGNDDDGGVTPTPTPEPPSTPQPAPEGPDQSIGYQPPSLGYPGTNNQTQNVNQDNDITSSVTGDNNTVTNTQDNSVSQVGGNSFGAYGTSNRAKVLRDRYVADVSRFARA